MGTEKGEETMLFRVLFENPALKHDSSLSSVTLQRQGAVNKRNSCGGSILSALDISEN